jgi:hypothetical protein
MGTLLGLSLHAKKKTDCVLEHCWEVWAMHHNLGDLQLTDDSSQNFIPFPCDLIIFVALPSDSACSGLQYFTAIWFWSGHLWVKILTQVLEESLFEVLNSEVITCTP